MPNARKQPKTKSNNTKPQKCRTKGVSCGTLREKLKLAGFFEERRYYDTPKTNKHYALRTPRKRKTEKQNPPSR
jgi:hypothetical protein